MISHVLINGIGTVGSRVARLLLSMGVEVAGVKYSASYSDRKTIDLIRLYEDFGRFPILVADGDKYSERAEKFVRLGLDLVGKDKLDYNIVIDATEANVTKKNIVKYKKDGKHYLVQGGTEYDSASMDFVSVPNTVGQKKYTSFFNSGVRQVSCNTTFCATALGLVLGNVSEGEINKIDVTLFRRCRDPGENKELKSKPEIKDSHHAADVMNVLPGLNGKVFSKANINDWEHFHRSEIIIEFNSGFDFDEIKESFKNYERCIFLENDIGEDVRYGIRSLINISQRIGVPDGDCLLPIYYIEKVANNKLVVKGYTPQRSIVALSCVDWVWAVSGMKSSWEEAFKYTNDNVEWYGFKVKDLKKAYEAELELMVPVVGV